MDERTIYDRLKAHNPLAHWQRIENAVGVGAPDVNVCHKGKEAWLELKVDRGSVLIRPAQHAWSVRRVMQGGIVWLLAINADGALTCFSPPYGVTVAGGGKLKVTSDPTFVFSSPIDWKEVLQVLLA